MNKPYNLLLLYCIFSVVILTACGQTGPLYLPEQPPQYEEITE